MSKKQLHSRLENLFANLEGQEPTQPQQLTEQPTSWTWECDADGRFTQCGADVSTCLGIAASQFLNQSLFGFHMHPASAQELQPTLQEGVLPVEANVFMQTSAQTWVPVRLNIFARKDEQGQTNGWRGFAQLLPAGSIPLPKTRPLTPPRPANPLPPLGPAPSAISMSGVSIEEDNLFAPAHTVWSQAGTQSLKENQAVTFSAPLSSPAAIAIPFEIHQQGTGVLEILDQNPRRRWSEDERLLVQEVAKELSLALENAQLYATVQQELAERIKAEQEILRRNQDLAALNQVGQRLSKLATRDEIYDLVYNMIGQVMDNRNLTIASFDAVRQLVKFPIATQHGERVQVPARPYTNDLPEYIQRTAKPLLLAENVGPVLENAGIHLNGNTPASLLAVPLLVGDRAVGAIILRDYEKTNAFSSIQAELLSTIASQTATALENENLFHEMQNALFAIENRERYQANVAQAVATLTETGTRALNDVLQTLNLAAQVSRVYFAQLQEDERGPYWRCIAEYHEPDASPLLEKNKLQHLPTALYPFWVSELREKGWVALNTEDMPSPERELLLNQDIQSTLMLAVPGKNTVPSFLAFDLTGTSRKWKSEEISVLRVAADAISNTFIREDLLEQLQATLDETESLYNASHRLALATEQQEMVAAVATGLRSVGINRAVMSLFEYDSHNKVSKITVSANWYNGRGTPPPSVGTEYGLAVYDRLLANPTPIFFDDIQDAQIDSAFRDALTRQNVRSCAVLPLWVGKRQIGSFMLQSEERHHFTGRETRSYPPLVDQMAIAVENQRLFEQTQQALSETGMLYKLSSGIAQSASTQELITLVAETILPASADRASLIMVTQYNGDEPLELEAIGYYDSRAEYQRLNNRIPAAMLPLVKSMTTEPVIIHDIYHPGVDPVSRRTLQQLNVISACMIPLRSSGKLIGLLNATARRPGDYTSEEIRLLQVAGNGIAVALERQMLLQEAQRRALELQTAAEIARDTTGTLSIDPLFQRFVELMLERFGYYHAAIFMLDETGSYAVVREATGEAGEDMKQRSHRFAIGSKSVIGYVTGTGEPIIVNDVTQSPMYYPNPMLPDTRAELGVPLKLGERVIGALDIHSEKMGTFTQDDIAVLQILADQIAIATENASAYELAQKAVEDMREVDRVKSQFLANMSHELRTPLNSIIGFSRVILKGIDGPINETQNQDLSAIYNSGQHLLSLINDILDLSKIEAGKMELFFTDVNIGELINSVMSTAVGLVKDKPVKLVPVIAPDLPTVRADSTRVRQVLLNLVSNAAKFTDEGSITIEAKTIMERPGRPELMVTVTDTGPGIAEKDRVKLFQAFTQVDDSPTRQTGGTGLGLSICRSLIDMHKGRIGLLTSEVGKGSTFFFTLRLPKPEPVVVQENLKGAKNIILAIDDDAQVISLYERYLKPQGYQVVALTDPKQAVAKAREIHPFAITLDINMPERDGWDVMHDLKSDSETSRIPVVICSIIGDQAKGFSMGAADYLIKPFLQEDLISSINRLNNDGSIREILVIDDDEADLRLVQKMLEEDNKYHCILAQGGKQGIEILKARKPGAIIMDLRMPEVDGFAVLDFIRQNAQLAAIPLIILSGADLDADQHQKLTELGQPLLSKGLLRENELRNTLEALVNQRQVKP